MLRNRTWLLSGLSIGLLAATVQAADLKVGDKAPALHIAKWVKGEAFDPSKGGPNDVYVVEFWATWCGPCRQGIPHLSELYDHFKTKNVHFVGVTDENPAKVTAFLDDGWDAKMRYCVAVDDDGATNKAWMEAAGKEGIPCAFVVQDNKIKWIGHPMAGLDAQVAELSHDKEFLQQAKEIEQANEAVMKAYQAEDWKGAIKALDRVLKIKPGDGRANMTKFSLLATKLKDTQGATKCGYEIVKNSDEPELLIGLAWSLLKAKELSEMRDVKLAVAASKKAVDITKSKDAPALHIHASAVWESGDHAETIKIEKAAIEAAKDKRMKQQFEATLAAYEKGKAPKDDAGDDEGDDDDGDSDE